MNRAVHFEFVIPGVLTILGVHQGREVWRVTISVSRLRLSVRRIIQRAPSHKRGSQEVVLETNRPAEPVKRKLKWLVIVLAVSLLGFGTALLLWPRDRITAESWQKIRIGMTEDEVAGILGKPTKTEILTLKTWQWEDPHLEEPADKGLFVVGERDKLWSGRRGMIEIEFDQENRVCWKSFRGVRWINEGILDRLRDWLGW
jgi:hypothetical protein